MKQGEYCTNCARFYYCNWRKEKDYFAPYCFMWTKIEESQEE